MARLIVSPLAADSTSRWGCASSTSWPRCAKRSSTGPGSKLPRRPRCWIRPWRSSAPSRRDAVLLGSAASSASSVSAARAARPRARASAAARRDRWSACPVKLGTLVPCRNILGSQLMFVNTMPRYEILSEEAMDVLDRGWRRIVSELGVEFLLPEAVELFRAAGQKVEGEQPRQARPRVHPRAGRQGAARVRPAGAQPRAQRAHRRRPHGLLRRLRPAVRARGRRAARRHDGRLRELREALAVVPGARLARAARSSSPTTRRSTRATSTWSTRCRRCPTSRTWARSSPARTRSTRSRWARSCSAAPRRCSARRSRSR